MPFGVGKCPPFFVRPSEVSPQPRGTGLEVLLHSAKDLMRLIQPVLTPEGLEAIDVALYRTGGRHILRVKVDRFDEAPVTLDQIEIASRLIGLELDRLDPIEGRFTLEVESPGPRRPLTRPRHYQRFVGLAAKIQTRAGETATGRIEGLAGESVRIALTGGGERVLNLIDIERAHLLEWPEEGR